MVKSPTPTWDPIGLTHSHIPLVHCTDRTRRKKRRRRSPGNFRGMSPEEAGCRRAVRVKTGAGFVEGGIEPAIFTVEIGRQADF